MKLSCPAGSDPGGEHGIIGLTRSAAVEYAKRGIRDSAVSTPESLLMSWSEQVRLLAGRTAAPTAAIIDSQSVRAAEEVARSSRGYDAGKKASERYLEPKFDHGL